MEKLQAVRIKSLLPIAVPSSLVPHHREFIVTYQRYSLHTQLLDVSLNAHAQ